MFEYSEYRSFVESKMLKTIIYKNSDITNRLLDSVCQFNNTPAKYLADIPAETVSQKLKQLLGNNNKPISVSYNIWLLHLFGYKKCNKCREIKILADFYFSNERWDLLRKNCITCEKVNNKVYKDSKPYKGRASTAKRRALKLKATPKWLSASQLEEIDNLYKLAKTLENSTGTPYHVDHIVPLIHPEICGLHVPWNLQVLTAAENQSKSNKLLLDTLVVNNVS